MEVLKQYDYTKWLTDRRTEFADLNARQDFDKDLVIRSPYKMLDKNGDAVPDVENLTLNDASVFATRVESTLIKANMQPDFRSAELTDAETNFIEEFTKDYSTVIDENLRYREVSSLMSFNIQQIVNRGAMITRSTPKVKDGKFSPGILPMDRRYTMYEYGGNKLKAISYTTTRSKEQIANEYGKRIADEMQGTTGVEVTDLWHEDKEVVFIGGVEVKNTNHGYNDELPFVVELCPSGLQFMDSDRMLRNGESIFANDRELYETKNKLGSILMTLTISSFMGGLQYESDKGRGATKPALPPYGIKTVNPIDKGTKGYFNMPINDVQNATRMLYSMVESALQQGSLPAVSYGSLQFPLSAVAISGLQEAEDPIYLPRLEALGRYYRSLYQLIIKQYIKLKLNVKLGTIGFQRQYPYQQLDKNYSLSFRFFSTSPKQQMAQISVAAALGDTVSDDYKRREVIQLENPDAEESKIWAEKAPLVSPAVAKFKIIQGLIERKQLIEANLMAMELGITMDQIMMGGLVEQPSTPAVKNPPKQIMPMFAGRIGAGGKQAPGYGAAESQSTEGGE
jgi:hypothetical protein